MNASAVVDLVPARLWSAGNLYLVFGRQVHLCVGDGARTVEVGGRKVARGRRPLGDAHGDASGPVWERLAVVDLGWTAVAVVAAILAVLTVRVASDWRRRYR
jgi:hypothetical protein